MNMLREFQVSSVFFPILPGKMQKIDKLIKFVSNVAAKMDFYEKNTFNCNMQMRL